MSVHVSLFWDAFTTTSLSCFCPFCSCIFYIVCRIVVSLFSLLYLHFKSVYLRLCSQVCFCVCCFHLSFCSRLPFSVAFPTFYERGQRVHVFFIMLFICHLVSIYLLIYLYFVKSASVCVYLYVCLSLLVFSPVLYHRSRCLGVLMCLCQFAFISVTSGLPVIYFEGPFASISDCQFVFQSVC